MRNGLLDLLKLLGAFLITAAHMPQSEPVWRLIANIFPMAMMPFFLTSGYYAVSPAGALSVPHTKKRLVKLLWMTLRWYLFYMAVSTIAVILLDGRLSSMPDLRGWIALFSPKVLLRTVLFQFIPGIGYQLWFMIALIYCNLLALAANRWSLKKLAFALTVPICLGHILLQEANHKLGWGLHTMIVSNAWTTGVPLFFMGVWFREHEKAVLARLSTKLLTAAVIVGMITPMVAYSLYGGGRYYVGNYVAGIALFLLALRYGPNGPENRFTRWAGEASTTVYLVHTLFVETFRALIEFFPETRVALNYLGAPISFALSLAVHEALRRIRLKFKA